MSLYNGMCFPCFIVCYCMQTETTTGKKWQWETVYKKERRKKKNQLVRCAMLTRNWLFMRVAKSISEWESWFPLVLWGRRVPLENMHVCILLCRKIILPYGLIYKNVNWIIYLLSVPFCFPVMWGALSPLWSLSSLAQQVNPIKPNQITRFTFLYVAYVCMYVCERLVCVIIGMRILIGFNFYYTSKEIQMFLPHNHTHSHNHTHTIYIHTLRMPSALSRNEVL